MIILGIVLLVIAYLFAIPVLQTLAIILVVLGAVLFLFGAVGHPVAGRRYWY